MVVFFHERDYDARHGTKTVAGLEMVETLS
jgi:hypothetical protein